MKSIQTRYDELIKANLKQAYHGIEALNADLDKAGCKFGPEVIPTFLKPAFISTREEHELRFLVTRLMNMVEKAVHAYFRYPELRPMYAIPKAIRRYIEIDPGYEPNIVITRPDALVAHGVYRFIEFNCDSPAGAGYADIQENLLKRSWPMNDLAKHYRWKRSSRMDALLKVILKCYRTYGGRKSHPHIAIVDWKSVRTQGEFFMIRKHFESRGYPAIVADPRDLKMKSGSLHVRGFRVDVVYRRVIVKELLEHKDEVRDFLRAYAHGKVCVVNSLRSRLAANKSILSIITNPAYNYLFTDEEIKIRDKHVPWTRLVVDGKKFYGGKSIYLAQMIDENRKDLVLKPSEGYGGRDVKIGKETSSAEWRRTIQRALRGGEHWVVQEYVDIPEMRVPMVHKKKTVLRWKKVNMNPYVFGGRYAGALARLSDASVINVSRGGGLIPTITYQQR